MLLGTRCLARNGAVRHSTRLKLQYRKAPERSVSFRNTVNARPATNEAFANMLYEQEMKQQWSRYRMRKYTRIFGRFAWLALGWVCVEAWYHIQSQQPEDFHMEISRDVSPVQKATDEEPVFVYETLADRELIFQPGTFRSRTSLHGSDEWFAFPWVGWHASGWPSVAHGGAIATLLSETMGQAAECLLPTEGGLVPEPASLRIDYMKTANTSQRLGIFIRRHHYTTDESYISVPSPSWGRLTDQTPPPVDVDRTTPRLFLAASIFSVDTGKLLATALGSFDIPEEHRNKSIHVDVEVSKKNSTLSPDDDLMQRLATFGKRPLGSIIPPTVGKG